jgi:hypothetical protein
VGTNISATPASKPSSAQFTPGGTKLNVMWCDPAGGRRVDTPLS